jgi:thiamine transporter ThiT
MANAKERMISLVTRLLIVAAVAVSISVVTAILLIQKFGATWNIVPVMVFAIFVPGTLAVAINYLYWRPRYRVL